MKIKELIIYGKSILEKNNIEDAKLIAKLLAEFILKMKNVQLIINDENEVSEEQKTRYYLALIEIIQGMPIQYITNKQEFMKMDFYVDENVLIPQPDTEILVEEVIQIAKNMNKPTHILDICTGSGCIGISLLKNIENANVTMTDISNKALEIAKNNCEKHIENSNEVEFIQSNMFDNITEKYDVIVSNPPYIESENIKNLPKDVKKEPHMALDGGKDGLEFYKILVAESTKYLNEGGYLCMEIGYNQKEAIIELLENSKKYKEIYTKKDLGNNDRVVIAKVNSR